MMFKSLDARTVIMLLEIICCGYSLVLGYLSDKNSERLLIFYWQSFGWSQPF